MEINYLEFSAISKGDAYLNILYL